MRVKTNLTPSELDLVSKGLKKLADKQREESVVFENNAERELFRRSNRLFEDMLNGVQEDIAKLFL